MPAKSELRLKMDAYRSLRHSKTGMSFKDWLKHGADLTERGPIGLKDISAILTDAFASGEHKQGWRQEAMRLSIASLLRRGWRPMLYDDASGRWD